jgi:hypothetical protein
VLLALIGIPFIVGAYVVIGREGFAAKTSLWQEQPEEVRFDEVARIDLVARKTQSSRGVVSIWLLCHGTGASYRNVSIPIEDAVEAIAERTQDRDIPIALTGRLPPVERIAAQRASNGLVFVSFIPPRCRLTKSFNLHGSRSLHARADLRAADNVMSVRCGAHPPADGDHPAGALIKTRKLLAAAALAIAGQWFAE